jgi:hypothetical protein
MRSPEDRPDLRFAPHTKRVEQTRDALLAAVRFGAEVLRADVAYPVTKSVA